MITAFQVGKTYYARSICDHDCIFRLTVAARTAKTITTRDGNRLGVKVWQGVEQVKPFGSYSMAVVIGADKLEG